jgi:quercetin dioxygenase-like cupin family protein
MKIFKHEDMTKGWFVGNFEPTAYKTSDFEVNYRTHPAGEEWPVHTHVQSTEINLLVSGTMTFQGQELHAGDIFVVEPWEISNPQFIEDCTVVCVRTPSVNDKVELTIKG